jgi:hypothetical protein
MPDTVRNEFFNRAIDTDARNSVFHTTTVNIDNINHHDPGMFSETFRRLFLLH